MFIYEIPNVQYRYTISREANGLYYLKYQKWDNGRSWNWKFPSGWADYNIGTSVHIYQAENDVQRDGNAFMLEKAAYKILDINEFKIVWYWKDEANAGKLPTDNLRIYDEQLQEIWNIKEFLNRSEMCTGIHSLSDNSFSFTTFMGENIVISVVELIEYWQEHLQNKIRIDQTTDSILWR